MRLLVYCGYGMNMVLLNVLCGVIDCRAPLHKIQVEPYLVVAALIGLPDAQGFVRNRERAMFPHSPTFVRVWGLDKPAYV